MDGSRARLRRTLPILLAVLLGVAVAGLAALWLDADRQRLAASDELRSRAIRINLLEGQLARQREAHGGLEAIEAQRRVAEEAADAAGRAHLEAKAELVRLRGAMERRRQEEARLVSAAEEARRKAAETGDREKDILARLDQLRRQLTEAETMLATRTEDLTATTRRAAELGAQETEARGRLDDLTRQIARAADQIAESERDILQTRQAAVEARRELDRLREQVAAGPTVPAVPEPSGSPAAAQTAPPTGSPPPAGPLPGATGAGPSGATGAAPPADAARPPGNPPPAIETELVGPDGSTPPARPHAAPVHPELPPTDPRAVDPPR